MKQDQHSPTGLAVRVAIAGSIVLALFAIVFFRLWFLQVLTGDHYVLTAAHNQTRTVALAPPRGEILDAEGRPLVTSTTALAVEIDPTLLPTKVNQSNILFPHRRDEAVYDRLAHVIGFKTKPKPCVVPTPPPTCDVASGKCPHSTTRRMSPIACLVAKSIAKNYYADVEIKQPVTTRVQYYIAERGNLYRGVDVQQVSVPGYPYGGLAAQTIGAVGRLTTAEQKQQAFRGVNPNAVVGQSGLEFAYDQYLRGTFGRQKVQVNASGLAVGQGRETKPRAGDYLKTSLNLKMQQAGDSALQQSIDTNSGQGGAFVAIDPQTGAINAMGSLPTYDPSIFTQPNLTNSEYNRVFGPSSNDPQDNRATQGQAPDGSTFKVITATAALQSGQWTPEATFDDTGEFCPAGNGIPPCFRNAGGAANGTLDLASAIRVSDDVFFYHLGDILNVDRPQGGPLQKWAKLYGIGQNPHIDIPGATNGILPTPAFYDARARQEQECETATGDYRYTNGHGAISATRKPGYHRSPRHSASSGGCGLATANTSWTVGDNINTAVGQGDDELSPLQLALVYSAIENGGTIVRPHLGEDIENADQTVLQKLTFPAQRHLHIDPINLETIQTGLHEAAQSPGGTSDAVMANFGLPVYGKTGTAQYIPTSGPEKGQETDSAWYACYSTGNATHHPEVVVAWVEAGGFGAVGAAPVAREILHQYYFDTPGPYVAGTSSDH